MNQNNVLEKKECIINVYSSKKLYHLKCCWSLKLLVDCFFFICIYKTTKNCFFETTFNCQVNGLMWHDFKDNVCVVTCNKDFFFMRWNQSRVFNLFRFDTEIFVNYTHAIHIKVISDNNWPWRRKTWSLIGLLDLGIFSKWIL